jgi:hypothetical protein
MSIARGPTTPEDGSAVAMTFQNLDIFLLGDLACEAFGLV